MMWPNPGPGHSQYGGGGGGGTPDLVNETFEGTGAPSSWTSTGSANFDYTAVPLAGSQSLRLPATSLATIGSGVFSVTELWFSALFKAEALPASGYEETIVLGEEFVDYGMFLYLNTDGTFYATDNVFVGYGQTIDAISAGTAYRLWGHYKKGTGTNAIIEFSFDVAANPRPNSGNKHCTTTVGHSVVTANSVRFGSAGTTVNFVFDNVQVASTDIY